MKAENQSGRLITGGSEVRSLHGPLKLILGSRFGASHETIQIQLLVVLDLIRVRQLRLGELDQHAVRLARVEEDLFPDPITVARLHWMPAQPFQLLRPRRDVPDPQRDVMHALSTSFQEVVKESVRSDWLHELDDPTPRELKLRPAEALGDLVPAHQIMRPQDVPDQRNQGGDPPGCNRNVVEAVGNGHRI